jgi:hypothetical protein
MVLRLSLDPWAGIRTGNTGKPNLKTGKELGWYGTRGMSWKVSYIAYN